MKQLLKLLLLIAIAVTMATDAGAAEKRGGDAVSREQLAEKQARHIAGKLALDGDTESRFITTYVDCQKAVWALGRNRAKGAAKKELTEQQTDSAIQARFSHDQKMLDIRKKYYGEYSKFLTAKQIDQIYKMERQMMKHLREHRQGCKNGKKGHGAKPAGHRMGKRPGRVQ